MPSGVIEQIRKKGMRPEFQDAGSETSYDPAAGVPTSVAGGTMRERDVAANPVNPPDGPPPAKNLTSPK